MAAAASAHVQDPRAMRALAHPTRLELLELIGREGSLTATEAGELTGESVPSCSFHLRQLAKYGFIESAPARGPREKPWRLRARGYSWPTADDAAAAAPARTLTETFVRRELTAVQAWVERMPGEPNKWQRSAALEQGLLYLTAEQLAEVGKELGEVIERAARRSRGKRPESARPVRIFAAAFPEPQRPKAS